MSVSRKMPPIELKHEIDRSTVLSGRPPKQIKVTALAVPGVVFDSPMLDAAGRRRSDGARQILVHPSDWHRFSEGEEVKELWGIPVVIGEP